MTHNHTNPVLSHLAWLYQAAAEATSTEELDHWLAKAKAIEAELAADAVAR